MGFFGRSKDENKRPDSALAGRAFKALGRTSSSGDSEDLLRRMIDEALDIFQCKEAAIALLDHSLGEGEHVSWSLEVVAGKNKGAKIGDQDCERMNSLRLGSFVLSSETATEDVQIKTTAMAFREDRILGCQAFKGRISLHENPNRENDLGDGTLTALAIPLRYFSHATMLAEKIKLGVLTLYGVPLRNDLHDFMTEFGTLFSQLLALRRQNYRDPLMGLRTESEIKAEVVRQHNLHEIADGKIAGGVVFGLVDSLTHYKKTIENETDVGAETASQFVYDVMRGVGQCISARSLLFPFGEGKTFRAGVSGRFGTSGFVCVLPLLSEDELVRFARALQKDVTEYNFPGEKLLEQGQITVSTRVINFDTKLDAATTWNKISDEISMMYRDQSQARGTAKLTDYTATIGVYYEKKWLDFEAWKSHRRTRLAQREAQQAQARRSGPPSRPPGRGGPPSRPPRGEPGRNDSGRRRPPGGRPSGPPSRPLIGQNQRSPRGRRPPR